MEDKLQELNAKWMYGIMLFIMAFIILNLICYSGGTVYNNVANYEIVYDSVVVRVETSVNGLETMIFRPEDVRFTDHQAKVVINKCLLLEDRYIYLPRDEYNAYREMLFDKKGD